MFPEIENGHKNYCTTTELSVLLTLKQHLRYKSCFASYQTKIIEKVILMQKLDS